MKKLPKIYQNEIKNVKNNKEMFDSLKNDLKSDFERTNKAFEDDSFNKLSVKEKILALINQKSYIFNTKVVLIFQDSEKECQIAGVVNNHLITMDNKIIKIDDLKDIKILKN